VVQLNVPESWEIKPVLQVSEIAGKTVAGN